MADNFAQFSFAIETLTTPEHAWLRELLALDAEHEAQCERLKHLLGGEEMICGNLEVADWPAFCHRLTEHELWVYAEDYGSPWNVALLVRAFLAEFRPQEVSCFSVAFTCSRIRVDEFGGESYVVTGKAIYSNADVPGIIIKALQTGKAQKLAFHGLEVLAQPVRMGKERSCPQSR